MFTGLRLANEAVHLAPEILLRVGAVHVPGRADRFVRAPIIDVAVVVEGLVATTITGIGETRQVARITG
jgi:hypothetical protein